MSGCAGAAGSGCEGLTEGGLGTGKGRRIGGSECRWPSPGMQRWAQREVGQLQVMRVGASNDVYWIVSSKWFSENLVYR